MTRVESEQIRTLSWTMENPWWRRRLFVLKRGELEIARLSWDNRMFGTLATGQIGDKRWTFKRVRRWLLRRKVTVRVAGTDEDVATVEFRWNGAATIRTREGDEIGWRCTKRWRREWVCVDQTDTALLTLKILRHFLRTEFQVQALKYDLLQSKLPWLLILSAYTVILAQDEAAALAAAAMIWGG